RSSSRRRSAIVRFGPTDPSSGRPPFGLERASSDAESTQRCGMSLGISPWISPRITRRKTLAAHQVPINHQLCPHHPCRRRRAHCATQIFHCHVEKIVKARTTACGGETVSWWKMMWPMEDVLGRAGRHLSIYTQVRGPVAARPRASPRYAVTNRSGIEGYEGSARSIKPSDWISAPELTREVQSAPAVALGLPHHMMGLMEAGVGLRRGL